MRNIFKNPAVIFFFFFGLIYILNLRFCYVEGDDASIVLYHALGRISQVQRPYSLYHSGLDFILQFFPAAESFVIIGGMLISAVAAFLQVLFLFRLVCAWLKEQNIVVSSPAFCAFCILFIAPEYFFMGLYLNPSVIAMAFVLGSHLMIRSYFFHGKRMYLFFISALLFGFGVTVRWNIGLYGLIIFSDLFFSLALNSIEIRELKKKYLSFLLLSWCILALICFVLWLFIQGVGFNDIYQTFVQGRAITQQFAMQTSLMMDLFASSAFYTPALLLFVVLGLGRACFQYRMMLYRSLFALPCFFILATADAKLIAPSHPFFIFFALTGLLWVEESLRKLWFRGSKAILLIWLFLPWIFGIKIVSETTLWGPGFEISNQNSMGAQEKQPFLEKQFHSNRIELAFLDAFAITTIEGPRPLGAYGGILLNGRWGRFNMKRGEEIEEAVRMAINKNIPLMKYGGSSFIEIALIKKGYITQDSQYKEVRNGLKKRIFYQEKQPSVSVYAAEREEMRNHNVLKFIFSDSGSDSAVIYSVYTSFISTFLKVPSPYEKRLLSPFTIFLSKQDPL